MIRFDEEVQFMIDTETLGTRADALIVEIGACVWHPSAGVGSTFSRAIAPSEAEMQRCTVDWQTLVWHTEHSQVLERMKPGNRRCSLGAAMRLLSDWMYQQCQEIDRRRVWARGPDFDFPKLAHAYAPDPLPWHHWMQMDMRTLANLSPVPRPDATIAHDALEDAVHQAKHAIGIFRGFVDGRVAV